MQLRREFMLPESDTEFLDAQGYEWETTRSDGNWLLIHHFHVPEGYTISEATVAINTSAYASGPLDMAYFCPPIVRSDGKLIGATNATQVIHGLSFQRWSRHYSWNSDTCSLITHIAQIEEWLLEEFQKR